MIRIERKRFNFRPNHGMYTIFLSSCSGSMGMQSWFSQEVFGSGRVEEIWWFQVPNDDNKMMIFELLQFTTVPPEALKEMRNRYTSSKKPKVMHQINVRSFFRSDTSYFLKIILLCRTDWKRRIFGTTKIEICHSSKISLIWEKNFKLPTLYIFYNWWIFPQIKNM